MINEKYIIRYLTEFRELLDVVTTTKSNLEELVESLISYYSTPNVSKYYHQYIKDYSKTGSKAFSVNSILYLLERRRIVITKGTINLVIKSGIVPIETATGRNNLATEYGLTDNEVSFLVNTLGMLSALTSYQDLVTGDSITTTIPSYYDENLVKFNDCIINLKTLSELPINHEVIPAMRLKTNFHDQDLNSISKIKELLLFIADYNLKQYKRLIRIIAYAYCHNELEKMFVMLGTGRNGKGLLLNIVSKYCVGKSYAMGSMYQMRKASTSTKESQILEVLTSRATLVEEELDFSIGLFNECYKNIVVGGSETGRKLGNNSISIKNNSVFYVATNFSDFKDVTPEDYAFQDRVIFTDFDNKFMPDEIYPRDRELVREVFDPKNKILNFKNVLALVMTELEGDTSRLVIPSQKSKYIKNNLFESIASQKEDFYKILASNEVTFDGNEVMSGLVTKLTGLSCNELKSLFKGDENVSFKVSKGYNKMVFTPEILNRKVHLKPSPSDFKFHANINLQEVLKLSTTDIRVTKLMYLMGIHDVSKEDMTEYFKTIPELKVSVYQSQPFIRASNETGLEILQSLIEEEEEVKQEEVPLEVSIHEDSFKVSVFRQPYFLRSHIDRRTDFTDKVESILSTPNTPKSELIKLFPYDMESRGEEIRPSNWLALDFDEPSNGTDFAFIVNFFDKLGYQAYIQQSARSLSQECPYVKFHILIRTTHPVTKGTFKAIKADFSKLIPFEIDPYCYYTTMINVSCYDWVKVGSNLLDTSGYEEEVFEREKTIVANEREFVEDRSHYTTLQDYLIDSNHEGAKVFLDALYRGGYRKGSRDNTVYIICMYLNDCLENYNMNPKVYIEGYQKIYKIVSEHPINDSDKFGLLKKIEHNMIEVK